jgi:hypothetical protein
LFDFIFGEQAFVILKLNKVDHAYRIGNLVEKHTIRKFDTLRLDLHKAEYLERKQ